MRREDLPIRTWKEPIDDNNFAVIAFAEYVAYGEYYAAGTFLITEARNWDWRSAGAKHFREQIDKNHGGRLPYICRARNRQ